MLSEIPGENTASILICSFIFRDLLHRTAWKTARISPTRPATGRSIISSVRSRTTIWPTRSSHALSSRGTRTEVTPPELSAAHTKITSTNTVSKIHFISSWMHNWIFQLQTFCWADMIIVSIFQIHLAQIFANSNPNPSPELCPILFSQTVCRLVPSAYVVLRGPLLVSYQPFSTFSIYIS